MSHPLNDLAGQIAECTACPRLVEWREQVARERRAAYADETYWGRPVPGFGDPGARLLVVGLAPAAHGANRTGRMFTGDRSGDWLFRALHRAGFANAAESRHRDDGLTLTDCWVTAVVKCAPPGNRPTTGERDRCRRWLHAELDHLAEIRVIVCLGGFAWTATLAALTERGGVTVRPRPAFGHGVMLRAGALTVLASYHPSQQNTFTGRLTEQMLDSVFSRAARLIARSSQPPATGHRPPVGG